MNGDGIDRRSLMAAVGAAAGSVALNSAPASAQRCSVPQRVRGPLVWLDMDQQELNEAYDQGAYAFNVPNISERIREANILALVKIGAPMAVSYGPAEVEKLRIYKTAKQGAPTVIYIHGGAWGDSIFNDTAFQAEMFVKAGANYVHVDFGSVGSFGGDLFPMADQCRRAVAWIYRNAESFGGSRERLYLAGHSSGAHLAGCVLIADWAKERLPADILKGAILASGLYDLKAVRLSSRSSYVKFTDAMENELSAQRHLARLNAPLILGHGTLETPEFQRQTREFAAALTSAGKKSRYLVGKGLNHFEIAESFGNPYGFMGRASLEMMGLTA